MICDGVIGCEERSQNAAMGRERVRNLGLLSLSSGLPTREEILLGEFGHSERSSSSIAASSARQTHIGKILVPVNLQIL